MTARMILATGACLLALAPAAQAEEEKKLNIFNWTDYIGETTIADFERETGIDVTYDTYDSNEMLEARLLAGSSGFDVVFPSNTFISRQIQADVFLPLDKSKLSNWGNLDPALVGELAAFDPGNQYAVPYFWGTNGFAYNVDMVKARMPDAPVDSLGMIFKPEIVSKFADCGVTLLDSPEDVVQLALNYLGLDPNSDREEDYAKAEELLLSIRPYIRAFDASQMLNALPNGNVCIAMSWSGDFAVAQARAEEMGVDVNIDYTVPKEGANIWFDGMLIPADAPHPENAHLFLDYMLRPEVIAAATNFTYYANANAAASAFVNPEIVGDPRIYPTPESRENLYGSTVPSQQTMRMRTRLWTRVKTGQ